ncbi:MAG: PEGA domain-containing protein [bacterium]|nr:PEGA domain-containing protein [bacterium]
MIGRTLIICLFAFAAVSVEGCRSTVVRVESDPPGAKVHYDFQPKGVTPTEFNIDWYGKHRLTLDHPEYGQRVQELDLKAPAYSIFPMDFFVAIMPFKVVDRKTIKVDLRAEPTPSVEASDHESERTQEQSR